MKLGVMQPYFFPYLAHFALIAAVDEWVVFDITQYTRKSWINRNRILHPSGSQYVSVPLLHSSIHIRICEAKVADLRNQERYVLGKLSLYKRFAPYYGKVCQIVRSAFAGVTDDSLVSLNVSGLRAVCEHLGLPFRHRICSQLALDYPESLPPGRWAPWICGRLGADAYINPIGGRDLFDRADFVDVGVELRFLDFKPFLYETIGFAFERNLSILDVLMWNDARTILRAIHENSSVISARDNETNKPVIGSA